MLLVSWDLWGILIPRIVSITPSAPTPVPYILIKVIQFQSISKPGVHSSIESLVWDFSLSVNMQVLVWFWIITTSR